MPINLADLLKPFQKQKPVAKEEYFDPDEVIGSEYLQETLNEDGGAGQIIHHESPVGASMNAEKWLAMSRKQPVDTKDVTTWNSMKGPVKISEMTNGHLLNSLYMMRRRYGTKLESDNQVNDDLEQELKELGVLLDYTVEVEETEKTEEGDFEAFNDFEIIELLQSKNVTRKAGDTYAALLAECTQRDLLGFECRICLGKGFLVGSGILVRRTKCKECNGSGRRGL